MAEKPDYIEGKKAVTFLDLFAGAGGISEGFLQSVRMKNILISSQQVILILTVN